MAVSASVSRGVVFLMLGVLLAAGCDDGSGGSEPVCGNGVAEKGEECDGNDIPDDRCTTYGYLAGTLRCSDSCRLDFSGCASPGCGNGVVDGTEQCDGNDFGGRTCADFGYYGGQLGCTPECRFDFSPCASAGRCGDGIIQQDMGEECDGTNFGGETCETHGYHGGILVCSSDCRIDWTASTCASAGRCGDGIIQPEFEECDGSQLGDATSCESLFPNGGDGALGCTDDCHYDTSACGWCGDGFAQTDEQCDGTDMKGETCETLGYYGGTLACTDSCTYDLTSCEAAGWCGDGVVQAGHEDCDGSNLNAQTCVTLGYYGGTLACNSECGYDLTSCEAAGRCGDGVIQAQEGEVCDSTNVSGQSCEGLGYHGGTLVCASDCGSLDLTSCEAAGRCGDGTVQWSYEVCDGTAMGEFTGTCATCIETAMYDVVPGGGLNDTYLTVFADPTTRAVYVGGRARGAAIFSPSRGLYYDFIAAKYRHDGTMEWGLQWPDPDSENGITSIIWDPDAPRARLLLSGDITGHPSRIIRVTTDGSVVQIYDHSYTEPGLVQAPDGTLYTSGAWATSDGTPVLSWSTVTFGATEVQILTHHEIRDFVPPGTKLRHIGFDVDQAGNLYFLVRADQAPAGFTAQGYFDVYVLKVNPSGSVQWVTQFASGTSDFGKDIELGPSGDLYVCVQVEGNYRIVRLDPSTGSILTNIGVGRDPYSTPSVAMDVLDSGDVLVAASSRNGGDLQPLDVYLFPPDLSSVLEHHSFPNQGTSFIVEGVTRDGTRTWVVGAVEGTSPGYEPDPNNIDPMIMFHDSM